MLFKKSKKLYIHIDCDSFFASAEIYANPSLKGKYVCVGSEIITACTYNCKSMGIRAGTPIWEAEKILGNKGIILPPNFQLYNMLSHRLLDYLHKNTYNIEPFSIDEAFAEITGLPEYYKLSLEKYLLKLQKDILREVGIPVSIGCSNTRIKSKMFSKINKPFGIFIGLDDSILSKKFRELPLSAIPFVGRKSQEALKYKTKTAYDFINLGYWNIKNILGKSGTDLWLELVGVEAFKIRKNGIIKSMSRSRSFNDNITNNKEFLWKELRGHFEIVFRDIIDSGFVVKSIGVLFRDRAFNTYVYEYKFGEHTNNRDLIYRAVREVFVNNYNEELMYRSMGVIMGEFKSYFPKQMNLFEKKLRNSENNYKLYSVINTINREYGDIKIGFGETVKRTYNFKSKCF